MALLSSGSSPGSLMLATPCTFSGMPPLEYAPAHLDVDGDVGEVDAVDDLEQRHAQRAAAAHHAVADLALARRARTRPEKMSASLGALT